MSRDALDRYYTPPNLAAALVGSMSRRVGGCPVGDPPAGGGACVEALPTHANPAAVEVSAIDPDAPALAKYGGRVADFLRERPQALPDWIIGNPPYKDAEAHTRRALSIATKGAAFLLRVGFMESQTRVDFWKGPGRALQRVYILAKRPSFTGGGTDSTAYAWYIFDKTYREAWPATLIPGWSWDK